MALQPITRGRILTLIKDAVRAMPTEMGSARPQSYAILNNIKDFNKDNLGYNPQDMQTNEVWTRNYQTANSFNLEFPIVCPIVFNGTKTVTDHKGTTQNQYNIRILIADNFVEQKENIDKKDQRTVSQIITDCEYCLNKIINYLFSCKGIKVETTPGVFIEDYFYPPYIDYLHTNNKIEYYEILNTNAAISIKYIELRNQSLEISYLDYPTSKSNIVGVWTSLIVDAVECVNDTYQFDDMGVLKDNSKALYFGQ